jgi:hypothetical protein
MAGSNAITTNAKEVNLFIQTGDRAFFADLHRFSMLYQHLYCETLPVFKLVNYFYYIYIDAGIHAL